MAINREQLIFGALVVGIAVMCLNNGKTVSPEAIARGPDGDDDAEREARKRALELIDERFAFNQERQTKWADDCKRQMDSFRRDGGGAPVSEHLYAANMVSLQNQKASADAILDSLDAIILEHDGLVIPSDGWRGNLGTEKLAVTEQYGD